VGSVFGGCHAPCAIQISTVDFENKGRSIVAATKTKYFVQPNCSYFFNGSQKSLMRLTHPFPHVYIILYIIYFVFVLNIAEILLAGR